MGSVVDRRVILDLRGGRSLDADALAAAEVLRIDPNERVEEGRAIEAVALRLAALTGASWPVLDTLDLRGECREGEAFAGLSDLLEILGASIERLILSGEGGLVSDLPLLAILGAGAAPSLRTLVLRDCRFAPRTPSLYRQARVLAEVYGYGGSTPYDFPSLEAERAFVVENRPIGEADYAAVHRRLLALGDKLSLRALEEWRAQGFVPVHGYSQSCAVVEELVPGPNPYEAPLYRQPALALLDMLYRHTTIRTLRLEGTVALWPDGDLSREEGHLRGDELFFNEPPEAEKLSPWLARYY